MGRRLSRFVHLSIGGTVHSYGPTDEVPGEHAELITNPAAWVDDEPDDTPDEPPRAGRGSGRDAWASYADGLGVGYDDDATRDDIIAAVDNQ